MKKKPEVTSVATNTSSKQSPRIANNPSVKDPFLIVKEHLEKDPNFIQDFSTFISDRYKSKPGSQSNTRGNNTIDDFSRDQILAEDGYRLGKPNFEILHSEFGIDKDNSKLKNYETIDSKAQGFMVEKSNIKHKIKKSKLKASS